MPKNNPNPSRMQFKNAALFLENSISDTEPQSLLVEQIHLPTSQPRRYFAPDKLNSLIESIREHGILEPLLVRYLSEGDYELVAGERRYRAAQILGLKAIPVIVRQLDDTEALQLALVENLQREDLNPVEETEALLQLIAINLDINVQEVVSLLYRMQNLAAGKITDNVISKTQVETVETIFKTTGNMSWESFVANRLGLTRLPEEILEVLRQGKIEYTKAVAIARVKDQQIRAEVLEQAIAHSWSLKQIKEKIKEITFQPRAEDAFSRCESLLKRTRKARKQFQGNKRKQKQLNSLLDKLEKLIEED